MQPCSMHAYDERNACNVGFPSLLFAACVLHMSLPSTSCAVNRPVCWWSPLD